MSTVLDFGHFALGSSRTFTFVFKLDGTPTDPGVAPVLNVTVHGVKTDHTSDLVHLSAGTYTWSPLFTIAGSYTATPYAPAGAGEDAQPITFIVDADPNYP